MPLYANRCRKCNAYVEVLRTLSEYEVPPGKDEIGIPGECEHEWVREIGVPGVVKSAGWGSKGNW